MIRIVLTDPALRTPEIEKWLKECARLMEPVLEHATRHMVDDLRVFGSLQRPAEDYVREALE